MTNEIHNVYLNARRDSDSKDYLVFEVSGRLRKYRFIELKNYDSSTKTFTLVFTNQQLKNAIDRETIKCKEYSIGVRRNTGYKINRRNQTKIRVDSKVKMVFRDNNIVVNLTIDVPANTLVKSRNSPRKFKKWKKERNVLLSDSVRGEIIVTKHEDYTTVTETKSYEDQVLEYFYSLSLNQKQ